MKHSVAIMTATATIFLVLLPQTVLARPADVVIRHKRVSDQRLAELQTILALANMKGRLVTVPVGFGRVDPAKIGRKRRSTEIFLLEKLRSVRPSVDFSEIGNEAPIQIGQLHLSEGSEEERRVY